MSGPLTSVSQTYVTHCHSLPLSLVWLKLMCKSAFSAVKKIQKVVRMDQSVQPMPLTTSVGAISR
eukprot:760198-Amphidinium_carterae.5